MNETTASNDKRLIGMAIPMEAQVFLTFLDNPMAVTILQDLIKTSPSLPQHLRPVGETAETTRQSIVCFDKARQLMTEDDTFTLRRNETLTPNQRLHQIKTLGLLSDYLRSLLEES